jgi:hypothetical protein
LAGFVRKSDDGHVRNETCSKDLLTGFVKNLMMLMQGPKHVASIY